jgi:hypothetical protein
MKKVLVCLTTAALLCAVTPMAKAQQGFKTPDEAASALVGAAKSGDVKAIVAVLGPDGEDIVSSGDQVADAATRTKFIAAYDAKHTIAMGGDNKAVMVNRAGRFPTSDSARSKRRTVAVRYRRGPGRDSVSPHWAK